MRRNTIAPLRVKEPTLAPEPTPAPTPALATDPPAPPRVNPVPHAPYPPLLPAKINLGGKIQQAHH